jgi:hypothetical protein
MSLRTRLDAPVRRAQRLSVGRTEEKQTCAASRRSADSFGCRDEEARGPEVDFFAARPKRAPHRLTVGCRNTRRNSSLSVASELSAQFAQIRYRLGGCRNSRVDLSRCLQFVRVRAGSPSLRLWSSRGAEEPLRPRRTAAPVARLSTAPASGLRQDAPSIWIQPVSTAERRRLEQRLLELAG